MKLRKVLACMALSAAYAVTAEAFDLSGGTMVFDNRFPDLSKVVSDCELKTQIMQHIPGQLLLGGEGYNGEKSGAVMDGFSLSSWCLMLEEFRWSHNSPQGGHPTWVSMLDDNGNGYAVEIVNGRVVLQKVSADGSRLEISESADLNNDFMTGRDFVFARNNEGELYFSYGDIELTGNADEEITVTRVDIRYGVYVWGYACAMDSAYLKGLETVPAVPVKGFAENLDGKNILILSSESLLKAPRRMGVPEAMAESLSDAGANVEILPSGTLGMVNTPADLLIAFPASVAADDIDTLHEYALSGAPLALLDCNYLSSIFVQDDEGGWVSADKEEYKDSYARMNWFNEYILGCYTPVKSTLLDDGLLHLTDDGAAVAGDDFKDRKVTQIKALPTYNTIEKQTLSSDVIRRNLFTVRTGERNWVQLEDVFVSCVAQLQHHSGGPYAGARVFISGMPFDGESPVNPNGSAFAVFMDRILAELETPVPAAAAAAAAPERPELTRENFFSYPGLALGTLCFGGINYLDNDFVFENDLAEGQFNIVCYCIPWKLQADDGEDVVDFEQLDWIIAQTKRIGIKLMLDPYPVLFDWRHYRWRQGIVGANPDFKSRYLEALRKVAQRVKDEPHVVAMWTTSHTHDADFNSFTLDETEGLLLLWQDYLRDKYGTIADLNAAYGTAYSNFSQIQRPKQGQPGEYNTGKVWYDFLDCHIKAYQAYLRDCIENIRSEVPDMPLTVRGAFIDFALTLDVIREYPDIATHCECVETTYDTEAYYRGLSRGFNTYITAENGWPKCPPAALSVSIADYLMGNYSAWTYSFGGPRWIRDMHPALRALAAVRQEMGVTEYPTETEIGLLTGDTTLYASNSPTFFSIEKLPHLQSVMERSGYPFVATSAQFPILEGRKVLLDDGTNRVFTPETRDALIEWLHDGGILIGFPFTGEYTLDGSESFRSVLDLPAGAGEFAIGKGRVIQMEKVPAAEPEVITGIFDSLDLFQPFGIYPLVNNATVYGRDGKAYLICFDKPRNIWGGFFIESNYDREIARVPEKQIIEIRPEIPFTRAVELFTGEELVVENGVIRMELPGLQTRVICFE